MKKVKIFTITLIQVIAILIPCIFLFDWIDNNINADWLDVLYTLGGIVGTLIGTSLLLKRWNKEAKIYRIVKTLTIITTTSTVMYCAYAFLNWIFPINAEEGFIADWAGWIAKSISLSVFIHIWDKRHRESLKNENDLVVAAECHTKAEAETMCAKLENDGIKVMIVEKESPMYINNDNNAPVQLQVMGKELKKAKEFIKLQKNN